MLRGMHDLPHPPPCDNGPGMSDHLVPLTVAAAELDLPLSRAAIARMCRKGKVPVTRIAGRWFARPSELRAAIVREVRP